MSRPQTHRAPTFPTGTRPSDALAAVRYHDPDWRHYRDIKVIDRHRYFEIWRQQTATATPELPADPVYLRYRQRLSTFADNRAYPARAVDRHRRGFLRAFDPGAHPIAFCELKGHRTLRHSIARERGRSARGRERMAPHLIVEHCVGCGRKVVKDGCKELLHLLCQPENVDLRVTQVSGFDWTASELDMRLACGCARPR